MDQSILNPAGDSTTWVIKGSGSKTHPIDGQASNAPWHRIEIWSDTWDGTGLDHDYVRVATSNGYVTTDQGIFRESRAIVVRGPLTSVVIAESHLKAASATAVKCRIISGGDDLSATTRLVKSRTIIYGDAVGTAVDLPDGIAAASGLDGYTEYSINSSAWAPGSTAAVTDTYPSGQTDTWWTATADDDEVNFFFAAPSLIALHVTTAGSGINQVYYLETSSRISND